MVHWHRRENETLLCAGKKAVEEVREVPQGTEGEVARVLQAVDHYDVLQVPVSAATDALRRAKRIKALATHPDKLGQTPAANEAFARVTEVNIQVVAAAVPASFMQNPVIHIPWRHSCCLSMETKLAMSVASMQSQESATR